MLFDSLLIFYIFFLLYQGTVLLLEPPLSAYKLDNKHTQIHNHDLFIIFISYYMPILLV